MLQGHLASSLVLKPERLIEQVPGLVYTRAPLILCFTLHGLAGPVIVLHQLKVFRRPLPGVHHDVVVVAAFDYELGPAVHYKLEIAALQHKGLPFDGAHPHAVLAGRVQHVEIDVAGAVHCPFKKNLTVDDRRLGHNVEAVLYAAYRIASAGS